MTPLQKKLLKSLQKVKDPDILNLCLDGAGTRARYTRKNREDPHTDHAFFQAVKEIYDAAYIKHVEGVATPETVSDP